MKFTHLHVHSHYSLLDGLPKIDEILDHVKKLGMDSCALTDHGVLYGAVEFYKKAKEKGIKPIIGSEAYVAFEKMTDERPNIDDKRYHLVLLAKNEEGYKNLVKLITKAHLEGFYYKPRIDEELLSQYSSGLIGLSACIQGKIPQLILSNKTKEAEELALKYQKIFEKDSFYLELQHHPKVQGQKIINDALISISKKTGIPLVATCDSHYIKPEDADAQDILMLINTGADPNDPERLTLKQDNFSMRTAEEMSELFKDVPEAISNTQKIADLCNFDFELGKTKLPYFPLPEGKTADDYIKELCYQRLGNKYPQKAPEVIERLEYELKSIKQTGFASYFLIVQDFVNWAKQNRIVVGPGRGSAGGSIVAYILNITNVDPLRYNLLFERFLNPERISMPDIDLDFTDRRRNEVLDYVAQKYGRDHVAQIITFGTMAARAAVRDVGRALGYEYGYCDRLAKLIPFGLTLDQSLASVDEFRDIYLNDARAHRLLEFAKKLEGVARHASTHACGVVISAASLDNIVPLQHPTQDDENIVTQYEMHSIEDLGLLKMDLLGLKNLTIIEDTLARIYVIHNKKIDIEALPLDDKEALKLFQKAQTIGIFQLESEGMQAYLRQLKPTSIEDIIAMVALYRPGPIALIPEYIAGKNKKKQVEYLHPRLQPILESTYGIIVYQEQVMKIAQELAGFTLSEADVLRKAIGKKIKKLLMAQKEKFIEGVKKNGIREDVGRKIWQWIEPFASYSFNRSHAAAYALIAYQTAYLKSHFPVEFMGSLLTSEKADVERIGFLISESKKMGIGVLPPDINESLANFTIVPRQNQIRFGLSAIKNVGTNIIEAVVTERKAAGPFLSIEDFVNRISSKDLNKKSLESLIKSGAFDKLAERNQLLFNLERLLELAREMQKGKTNGQKGLFEAKSFNTKITLLSAKPATDQEKLAWEKELLGLFVTSHPLENFRHILEKKVSEISKVKTLSKNKNIKVGGIIASFKKIITKTGRPMLFVNLEDLNDKIEVVVFPSIIDRNPTVFQENKVVFISGHTDNRDGTTKIICETIEEVLET
ncbi:MAG: DNA polymerase III subunit alpha [Candidatus Pacebacteria bacterium]|nr:DNA polymerase III subunit alpha [Candidatus Paceibacterota bacterium]